MYNNLLLPVILALTPFAIVYSSTVSTTTMFSTTMSWQARILNSSSSLWIPANTDYEKKLNQHSWYSTTNQLLTMLPCSKTQPLPGATSNCVATSRRPNRPKLPISSGLLTNLNKTFPLLPSVKTLGSSELSVQ